MKSLQESLIEAVDNLLAGKYKMGKGQTPFKLDAKTLSKNTMKDAKAAVEEKGFKDVKIYVADKTLVYFISGDKVVAKIYTLKPSISNVMMNYYDV